MLEELHLENFVLFEKETLSFAPGLNAISGETGAGKSLVATAIGLALGQRAAAEVIRSGADEAAVTAVFRLDRKLGERLAEEAGVGPDEEGVLALARVVRRDGRNRSSLNGRPASASALRQVSRALLDVSAQNEQTALADPERQRQLLDSFGSCEREAGEFAALFADGAGLLARLEAGDAERERARRRREEVRDDLERLAALRLAPEADAALEERIRAMSHAEAIRSLCNRACALLYDAEDSAHDVTGRLCREAEEFGDCSPELGEAARCLREAAAGLDEAARCFRAAEESASLGAGELEAAIERSEALKAAARRLGCAVDELPQKQDELRREAERLAAWDVDTGQIRKLLDEKLAATAAAGLALREKRAKAAKKLATAVRAELAELGMEQSGFAVELRPLWEKGAPELEIPRRCTAGGLEAAEFMLSPNPGEAPAALRDTASGGENSRAMLAIKAALARIYAQPVLIFDEVDSGVGGRLGETVGLKLKQLARGRQVIVITHLPQVAACAEMHVKIHKRVEGKRTRAAATRLAGAEREEEIAQMIQGKASTATTLRQAREMLARGAEISGG